MGSGVTHSPGVKVSVKSMLSRLSVNGAMVYEWIDYETNTCAWSCLHKSLLKAFLGNKDIQLIMCLHTFLHVLNFNSMCLSFFYIITYAKYLNAFIIRMPAVCRCSTVTSVFHILWIVLRAEKASDTISHYIRVRTFTKDVLVFIYSPVDLWLSFYSPFVWLG